MGNHLILANWKSNKSVIEALGWLKMLNISETNLENKEVIVCPSFTALQEVSKFVAENSLPVKIGTQDVSPFKEGSYTGEINAIQIKEFAKYVLIGHSERRENFHEDDNVLANKVSIAVSSGVIPIYCVSDVGMKIPSEVKIVAYEPLSAIGTGNSDTPEDANSVAKAIKDANANITSVLYGGSVTPENVANFTKMENIDGVLVGKASLDASDFSKIVQNA